MTPLEARDRNVEYLIRSAAESLESAKDERTAGRYRFAMNRVYYACFYAASAVLLSEGRHFVKHAGVRSAMHKDLVNPGRLEPAWGDFYDEMFRARQSADYGLFVDFDELAVAESIRRGELFVAELRRMLGK